MLNHQLILTDSEGRLRCTLDEPTEFNGGTPTKDGLLCVVDVDGVYFVNGLGYGPEGRITYEQEVNPEPGGFIGRAGRMRSSLDGVPMFWLYGLPMDANGQICITLGDIPPPDTRAFSSAFSAAFD